MTEPYAESVIYVFVKGNNILTEKRYIHDSFVNCLPGGGIEETDRRCEDYASAALQREVKEELLVDVITYKHILNFTIAEVKNRFYVFIVTEWNGIIPEYTVEPPGSGQRHADLKWVSIHDYLPTIKHPQFREVCQAITEYLAEQSRGNFPLCQSG
ncbi:MAG: NUDIX domain-containing protein [Deltaproteobacteria bacterium]|nr:NUDIX domain-containing protein [Deltaproteobacteria bacterium]